MRAKLLNGKIICILQLPGNESQRKNNCVSEKMWEELQAHLQPIEIFFFVLLFSSSKIVNDFDTIHFGMTLFSAILSGTILFGTIHPALGIHCSLEGAALPMIMEFWEKCKSNQGLIWVPVFTNGQCVAQFYCYRRLRSPEVIWDKFIVRSFCTKSCQSMPQLRANSI